METIMRYVLTAAVLGMTLSGSVLAGAESALDQEAIEFAKPTLLPLVPACKGGRYVKRLYNEPGKYSVYEIKGNPSFAAQSNAVSASDRRQGIEWDGVVRYRLNTSVRRIPGEKKWQSRNVDSLFPLDDPEVWVQKAGGQWRTRTAPPEGASQAKYRALSCREVKGGKQGIPSIAAPVD